MELPLISIVTPSYNQAAFLEDTLQSVVSQNYPRTEHIVVDGGSTDGSVDIIRRYAPHLRSWVSEPDRGQSHAINKGFLKAQGDVLAWLNSDDTYMPGALAEVGSFFARHPDVDLVYGDYVYTDAVGRPMRRRHVFATISYESLLYHDYLGQPAVFFRRSLYDKVGPLDESLHYCMDWDLFLRMWRVCRPWHLPSVLATYRLDQAAKSNAEDTPASLAAAHLVQRRHMNRRFSTPWLNRAWHRACFYGSFLLRAWTVVRDNPIDYFRTINQMFPGRRLFRLLVARLRSPFSTNHRMTHRSRAGRWMQFGAAVVLIAAMRPDVVGAARRNWAYLHLLRDDAGRAPDSAMPASRGTRADDLLVLRQSVQRGDWISAERMLARTLDPDRLAPLIVLQEAGRRVTARDLEGARAALAIVAAQPDYDSVLWYRLGEAYERTNSPEDAVKGYARGAAGDPTAPWTEGRHRIAMIYQRAEQWQPLADLLAPLLGIASDEDLGRPIQPRQLGGAVWQETFLALGNAYDHLGKAAEAEATYERIGRIAAPRRDWTLNRALVYLARAKRARGDLASALEAVSRALDLSTEFDASYRREYELDTAAEADRVIDQARREGQLFTLQASVDDLVRRAPESPASWYLRGVASEAACDLVRARAAYERATSLIRPGAGAFLAARPVDPAKGPCPPR